MFKNLLGSWYLKKKISNGFLGEGLGMGGANFIVPVMLGLFAWEGHCLRNYTVK